MDSANTTLQGVVSGTTSMSGVKRLVANASPTVRGRLCSETKTAMVGKSETGSGSPSKIPTPEKKAKEPQEETANREASGVSQMALCQNALANACTGFEAMAITSQFLTDQVRYE